MKKILIFTGIILSVFVSGAQNYQLMRFSVRQSGSGNGCDGPWKCPCPLGICFSRGVLEPSSPLMIESDEGKANMSIFGTPEHIFIDSPRNQIKKTIGYVKFVFHQKTATEKGVIPVDADYIFRPEVSTLFGYNRITILKGEYVVQSSLVTEFGEVVFKCYFD